jgi:CRISPR-associated protein Cas1
MADIVFTRIASPSTLAAAWQRVRRNGGGPGIDGLDIEAFSADAERRIAGLSRALFSGLYRPRRLLRIDVAKPAGGVRHLAVPALLDRVAQAAAAAVLSGRLDARLSDASFAYRRGRSVGHALGRVLTYRIWGCRWAFDTDIADFFDSIPHQPMLDELAARIASPRTIDLVRLWLSQAPRPGVGVLQGSPLSPLLSNVYLDPVDRLVDSRRVRLVRYADNILLLTVKQATARWAGERLAGLLAARGLRLNPSKTRLVPLDDGLVFLGCRIGSVAHVPPAEARAAISGRAATGAIDDSARTPALSAPAPQG